ncbi:DUF4173 domain-containing protein [Sedimentibacter sp. zth1]|uniref:DUF4153 domain-containing protein n=1 Tax=Sedimentibacter sp. zth1 TaxID=2816908 RepID=UPI001A91584E|nr:DUF4173 domain-containing protein [Sedimentibacter sp. zth1]QSX05070.1 DUF4173 domain-containing protein [Sedimentibacter sp. zth1]
MMNSLTKTKLLIYSIISAISFPIFIMVQNLGIGIALFSILQFTMIYYLTKNEQVFKNKKGLLLFLPIFMLCLSFFTSDMFIFRFTNFIAIFVLYSAMVLMLSNDLNFRNKDYSFLANIIKTIFTPLCFFSIPFKWLSEKSKNNPNRKLALKVLLGIVISIPCITFLIFMLSSADIIFSEKTSQILNSFSNKLNPTTIIKIIIGFLAGLYLFGLFYNPFDKLNRKEAPKKLCENFTSEQNKINELKNIMGMNDEVSSKDINKGDFIVINIVLTSVLIVYTLFTFVQFKYLFSGKAIPYGFTYAEYARRGFFELLFLSIINIGLIYIITVISKFKDTLSHKNGFILSKGFLFYLCTITVVLLISSYYRMHLYNSAYGLTRLRILVLIFLVFEAAALIVLFYYIYKPNFNIIFVYTFMCLIFYLTVNLANIDYFIAKNNIDMYYEGNHEAKDLDTDYLFSLSADAAPQIARFLDDTNSKYYIEAKYYFERNFEECNELSNWQSFNLSRKRANDILFNKTN